MNEEYQALAERLYSREIKMDKKIRALTEEMVSFYNESRSLFNGGGGLCNTNGLQLASMDKPETHEDEITVFDFTPFFDDDKELYDELHPPKLWRGEYVHETMMGVFITNLKIDPYYDDIEHTWGYLNTIAVNTASYVFDKVLETCRGFELALLHAMIHINNDEEEKFIDLNHLFSDAFTYVDACQLSAECYPSDTNKRDQSFRWSKLSNMDSHNLRFVTYCNYIAENLIKHEKLLTRALNGRVIEGKDDSEKKKWLATQIYWANTLDPEKYKQSSYRNIRPDQYRNRREIKYIE